MTLTPPFNENFKPLETKFIRTYFNRLSSEYKIKSSPYMFTSTYNSKFRNLA